MKITDILENYPALRATSPSTTSPQAYAGIVRQAVAGQPSPTNPYEGLSQLRGTTTPDDNPTVPMGAPPVPDQQPTEALPGMRDLPQPSATPMAAFEAADWTMTFRDFLALYAADKGQRS